MSLLSDLGDALFPRVCHVCGVPVGGDSPYVCPACLARLPRTGYHRVPDNAMEQRFLGLFPFRQATGHFFYSRDSGLAVLMHDLKYHRFPGLARHLGRIVASELLSTGFLTGIDMAVPVPMHFMKQAARGYNQAEEIARGIGRESGIPVVRTLRAVRPHRTQTSLTIAGRRENTDGLFAVRRRDDLVGKSVLIVDDVCTTGATLASAAESLLASVPDAEVSLLTLGVTF